MEKKEFEVVRTITMSKVEKVSTDNYELQPTFDWDAKDGKAYEANTDNTDWSEVFEEEGIADVPYLLDCFVEVIDELMPTASDAYRKRLEYLKQSCQGWRLEDCDYFQEK